MVNTRRHMGISKEDFDYTVGSGKYTYFSCRLLSVDTTSLALSLLVLKHCTLGFVRRMKTRCLSSEESQIVGMHKVDAKKG